MNAELIKALRNCSSAEGKCAECAYKSRVFPGTYNGCKWDMMQDAADALEAAEKRIAELEDDLRNSTISNPELFKIYRYSMKDLLLFADMCKRNDVQESDLKQAAWNLELAVRAVMNERQEMIEDEMKKITMRFTPDFEKAYAEMKGEEK